MTQPTTITIEACAEAAHEVNRVYCAALGDTSQPTWRDAPRWQKSSAINGVRGALAGNTPEQSHESWTAEKVAAGWTFGAVKDPEAKTHPCLVPYAALPVAQRMKDVLFLATVRAMASALMPGRWCPCGMPACEPADCTLCAACVDAAAARSA